MPLGPPPCGEKPAGGVNISPLKVIRSELEEVAGPEVVMGLLCCHDNPDHNKHLDNGGTDQKKRFTPNAVCSPQDELQKILIISSLLKEGKAGS